MARFYVALDQILEGEIVITGPDVSHIRNVLRMKAGDRLTACDGQGRDYICEITALEREEIRARELFCSETASELPVRLVLFQGLPKKDKMELIIQKAVELGAAEIVPVIMKRCVAKLEDSKKEEKKRERWQRIAESAAKQSGRGIIPFIRPAMAYARALEYAKALDMLLIPYENQRGIRTAKEAFQKAAKSASAGILIGPEGGFEPSEIEDGKKAGAEIISLGKRILRTETAGLAAVSMLMYEIEWEREQENNGSISG